MIVLQFKGQWRQYQERILSKADQFVAAGHLHLVAAPGSGKTTLGIEFISRFGQNTLILVPTITIREQWVERIKSAFLPEGADWQSLISQNLKDPKRITVATYQSLHSAMTHYKGKLEIDAEEDEHQRELVDFSGINLVQTMQSLDLGTLCLDECHHLRNEWWKSLEDFRHHFPEIKLISLTATPPLDSDGTSWQRYMTMCGQIDEEILVPELVKEGSLCPHQDFVYFSYPTKEESRQIEQFEKDKQEFIRGLLGSSEFLNAVQTHGALRDELSIEELLEYPAQLSALLIFQEAQNLPYPEKYKKLLGAKKLPVLDSYWLEVLLQGILYQVPDWYHFDDEYRKQLERRLSAAGLIEKKQVRLQTTQQIENLLTQSVGKLASVCDIFMAEYRSLGKELHQLILTDYIRKDLLKHLGGDAVTLTQLGVLPFFEILRRKIAKEGLSAKLAVLCGSVVIVPSSAISSLEAIKGTAVLDYLPVGHLKESDYVEVRTVGNAHFLTNLVTSLFNQGEFQVLMGTKSLLGEGWDAPCVNSLIMASFVGSFMLTNQMRGRAIRAWEGHPDKTSNIWHLVSVNPLKFTDFFKKSNETWQDTTNSQDSIMLRKRMDHFLGLSYDLRTIENGSDRIDFPMPPYTRKVVDASNQKNLELSQERAGLQEGWQNALAVVDELELRYEVGVDKTIIPFALFYDVWKALILSLILMLLGAIIRFSNLLPLSVIFSLGLVLVISFLCVRYFYWTPFKRMEKLGQGVLQVLKKQGYVSSEQCQVQSGYIDDLDTFSATYLKGGSLRDKEIYAQTIKELFEPIDNQRYLLYSKRWRDGSKYLAVPSLFAKRKQDAEAFLQQIKPYLGTYHLVYTRSEEGRKQLLEARLKALGNRQERLLMRKRVKSALE